MTTEGAAGDVSVLAGSFVVMTAVTVRFVAGALAVAPGAGRLVDAAGTGKSTGLDGAPFVVAAGAWWDSARVGSEATTAAALASALVCSVASSCSRPS